VRVEVLTVPCDSDRFRERTGIDPEYLLSKGLLPLLKRLGHSCETHEVVTTQQLAAEIGSTLGTC
jgi:hypothetical protein